MACRTAFITLLTAMVVSVLHGASSETATIIPIRFHDTIDVGFQ
jgi:hypothetical protein